MTRRAIRTLARRWLDLADEINTHDKELDKMIKIAAPTLAAEQGVTRDVAAKLLMTAGDNPHRIGTEAGFAALCGVNPIAASSGKTTRHRLNRTGDRQANNALWVIAMVRLRHDPETRVYPERRKAEGLSHREIVRCLKRYLARRLYPIIVKDIAALTQEYQCRRESLARWMRGRDRSLRRTAGSASPDESSSRHRRSTIVNDTFSPCQGLRAVSCPRRGG